MNHFKVGDRRTRLNQTIGVDKAHSDMWCALAKELYRVNPEALSEEYAEALAYVKKLKELKKLNYKEKSSWVLITINPDIKNVSFADFEKRVCKAFTKKWIVSYIYAYEVRPKDDKGFHVHGFINTGNKSIAEIRREFRVTFKDIVGNSKHVHVLPAQVPRGAYSYVVKDTKKSTGHYESKQSVHTEPFKKQNCIADFYEFNFSKFEEKFLLELNKNAGMDDIEESEEEISQEETFGLFSSETDQESESEYSDGDREEVL